MPSFSVAGASIEFLNHQETWHQLRSIICLLQKISTVVHPVCFGIILLYLMKEIVFFLCKNRLKLSEKEDRDDHLHQTTSVDVRPNLSSIATMFCSIILLGTHLTLLSLLLINGIDDEAAPCTISIIPPLLSEIIQVMSWAIVTAATYRILVINKCLKFPGILRLWWLCSFFFSAIPEALSTVFFFTSENHKPLQDFAAGLIIVVACTCLLFSAIRAKTGTVGVGVIRGSSSLNEPLLINGKTDKTIHSTTQGKGSVRESLYAKSTLVQLVTFSWLNPLFVAGNKKPLEQDEIPDVDRKDSARILSDSLDESLQWCIKEKEDERTTTPVRSFYRAILLFIGKKAMINALFAVVSAFSSYVGPYLINDFVDFLSDKKNQQSLKPGYLLALGFLGAKMIETVAQRQWIFGARQLGMRLRVGLISHIYKKGLVLSTQSRQSHTSGEIINYMSVDIQRITDFVWYLNIIWMLPIQISLAIFILHTNLGLGSLAALAATLLVMSCNIPLTRAQKSYQSKIMESKDARMKATSEVLRNIKTIKLQAWDSQFLEKLESLRRLEYNWIWKSLRLGAVGAFIFWGSPTFISVVTFGACILMGIPLTAGRVLAALATFRMLQDPIFSLPDLLNVIAQAKVSVDRVASYLQEEEIQRDAIELVPHFEDTPYAIDIEGGRFGWETSLSSRPTLDGIQLKIKKGMKVAVCGTVGSGKSSLLSGIIGEICKLSGSVRISGSKAYVPQSPWILTGNIRDNILFGNAYDGAKYERTIKACALEKDLELFSYGDLTEIGERGITMSGGQKQRIQIARAVYHDADIYLLDDPFSAVDALTGSRLFQDCLMGILKDKTILFVTHQVEFLPAADLILVMENGRIAQAGSFKELLEQNIGFENLVGAHSQALETVLVTVKGSSRSSNSQSFLSDDNALDQLDSAAGLAAADDEKNKYNTTSTSNLVGSSAKKVNNVPQDEITEQAGRLIQDEERERGSIGKEVYWSYLTIAKGGLLVPFIILAQSSFQVLQIASNYWIAWASPTKDDTKPLGSRMNYILLIYTLLSVAGSLCVLVRATLVAKAGLLTAQKLFTNMLRSLFGAPMAFFDSTPTGRILNRASSDQSVLDLEMANRVGWAAFSIIQLVGTVAVISQVAWEVCIIFIPVIAICICYKQYYIPTARELARLAEIQKAPILHHFAESLAGAATIRAFDQKGRFTDANLELVDGHSRPWFHNVSAMEWLSFRLNQLSNFVFAFSLLVLVSLPDGIINPSIAGLAVTYGINLNVLQASVIWNICNMENKIISVERILQYSNLTRERPLVIPDSRPPHNWPTNGTISFIDLQVRYAEYLPAVLKNISCTFPGRKKIGVVGRTGSGKSTLIQAIFRIVEPTQGSIFIDNVDICNIGLHDLRSRLSVIPQDPTMFEGTVRGNVDPLQQYADIEIWKALDKCQLGDVVRAKEGKLQSAVVENGENWSVGQRQLFCLVRALLKRSSILILDEATASMDSATDGLIQKVISQEFQDRTIVTIAHRIHTVINSDLVLVLSEGRIAEFDSPSGLLRRENSVFSRLIEEYSTRSQSFNNLAKLEGG